MTDDLTFPPPVAHSAEGHYAQKLLNDLMENYSSALRPVEDTDRALNVTLQITLSQIKDMVGTSCKIPQILILTCSLNVSISLWAHIHSNQTTVLSTTKTLAEMISLILQ